MKHFGSSITCNAANYLLQSNSIIEVTVTLKDGFRLYYWSWKSGSAILPRSLTTEWRAVVALGALEMDWDSREQHNVERMSSTCITQVSVTAREQQSVHSCRKLFLMLLPHRIVLLCLWETYQALSLHILKALDTYLCSCSITVYYLQGKGHPPSLIPTPGVVWKGTLQIGLMWMFCTRTESH